MDRTDREAYLDRALVGGREPRRIEIVDHDPDWPARFRAQRDRVVRALGSGAIRVEHIGSTAVPDLAAKPIIDVLVTVKDPDADAVIAPALEAAGYRLSLRRRQGSADRVDPGRRRA